MACFLLVNIFSSKAIAFNVPEFLQMPGFQALKRAVYSKGTFLLERQKKMTVKYIALLFQAVLPAFLVMSVWRLTTVPRTNWHLIEYFLASLLIGSAVMIATALLWRLADWLHDTVRDNQRSTKS